VGVVLLSGILFFPASVTRNYQTREVLIPRGAAVETIAGILKANGLVKSPTLFVLAARVLGHDRKLKAGRYTIPVGASIYRILKQLSSGMGKNDMVTIPEGLRSEETARILATQSKIDPSRFVSLTHDSAFAASLGVPSDRLEGYLYPDTYPFYPLLSPDEVARVMVGRALRVFEEELSLPGAREGLSMHELVTLASMVEAEAVMPVERPRIVEAPEILPPPPALGGMMLEASRAGEADRKTGADLALPLASLPRRIWAGFLDAAILIAALAGFGAIFGWINPDRPPIHIMATAVSIVAVVSWAAYHFLFMVYTGSTPGLRLARLQLVRFDGSMTKRRVRRWRVLASYLSAFSLGLGYLWSVLDEDSLCWHDRITHTHLS